MIRVPVADRLLGDGLAPLEDGWARVVVVWKGALRHGEVVRALGQWRCSQEVAAVGVREYAAVSRPGSASRTWATHGMDDLTLPACCGASWQTAGRRGRRILALQDTGHTLYRMGGLRG